MNSTSPASLKVLWVFAHPEPRSLNAALRDEGLRVPAQAGHQTALSDLYAMAWKPTVDREDFAFDDCMPNDRVALPHESKRAQVILTTGSPPAPLGPRGINGDLEEVLFPLLHGT